MLERGREGERGGEEGREGGEEGGLKPLPDYVAVMYTPIDMKWLLCAHTP